MCPWESLRLWRMCAGLFAVFLIPWGHVSLAGTEIPPSVTPRFVDTENFRIVYDPRESEEAAQEVAAMAEEVRRLVLNSLKVEGPGRYTIILLDNFDAANGSASGYPSQTIRLYLTSPDPPAGGVSDISDSVGETWLWNLLIHEYTHAVHLTHFSGWTPAWKWLFHSNPFYLIYPGWFTEGMAVAMETLYSSRGRGRTAFSDMCLRVAVTEDAFLEVGQWGHVTGWPRGGSRYLYGGAFLYYIHRRFGEDVFRRTLDATNSEMPWVDDVRLDWLVDVLDDLGFWKEASGVFRAGGLERGFLRATGIPLSELLADWKKDLTLRYSSDLIRIREAGVSRSRPLTRLGGGTRSPMASPDGSTLAYIAGGDSHLPGLEIVSPTGGRRTHLLSRNDFNGNLAWTPDGSRIMYSRTLASESPLERILARSDLFAFDLKSGTEHRLTRDQRLRDPDVSSDGTWMVAIAGGGGRTKLVRLATDGSSQTLIFAPPPDVQLSTPRISPDGKHIACSVQVQQLPPGAARYAIGIVDAEGSGFRLLEGGGVNREPSWHGNDRIVFSSDRTGVYNLVVADVASGTDRLLTNMETGAFQPSFHAASGSLYFRGYSVRGFDIHQLVLSPQEKRVLDEGAEGRPVPILGPEPSAVVPPDAPVASEPVPAPDPSPPKPHLQSRPYRFGQGIQLLGVSPFLGADEGSARSAFDGGRTLGLGAYWQDPFQKHSLYSEAEWGVLSHRPSYYASYVNQYAGFPLGFYVTADAALAGTTDVDGLLYATWDRVQAQGLGLGLQWRKGHLTVGGSGGGGFQTFNRFLEADDSLLQGRVGSLYQQVSLSWGVSNSYRVAQGHYLSFGSTQDVGRVWNETAGSPLRRAEFVGQYTGRKSLGRGVLDFDGVVGTRTGYGEQSLQIGGFSGLWALPGLSPVRTVAGSSAGTGRVTLVQDLWRIEKAIGDVPLLYLDRVTGYVSAGVGIASSLRPTATPQSGQGLAIGMAARMFSIRPGLVWNPSVSVGIDPVTGHVTYWLDLNGFPQMYLRLLPIGLYGPGSALPPNPFVRTPL